MKQDVVITISRQFASGGRIIGQKLAEKLGIPLYDKEIIALAAKESGYKEEFFEQASERSSNKFMFYLSSGLGNFASWGTDIALDDKLFLIQADIIRSVAIQGSCIIIGRCADYILNTRENLVNLFIYSDIDQRIQRAVNEYHLKADNIKEAILSSDKKRAAYYNYYSDLKWGKPENYHLMINSDSVGIDACTELLYSYVKMRQG